MIFERNDFMRLNPGSGFHLPGKSLREFLMRGLREFCFFIAFNELYVTYMQQPGSFIKYN